MKCRSRAPGHGAWLKKVSRTLICKVSYSPAAEKCTIYRLNVNFDCQWSVKCRSRVPVHGVCLKTVQDNYYARFHTHSYHGYKEMNFISRLNVNFLDLRHNFDKVSGA